MLIFQILFLIFFLIAVIRTVVRYRNHEISGGELVFWMLLWMAAGLVVIRPNATFYIARLVGVGRGADVIVYSAIVLLFSLLFKVVVKLDRINRDITVLTRKIALQNPGNKKDL